MRWRGPKWPWTTRRSPASPASSARCGKPSRLTTLTAARVRRWNGTRGAGPPCGEPPKGLHRRGLTASLRLPGQAGQRGKNELMTHLEETARGYTRFKKGRARRKVSMDHEKVTRLARQQRTLRETV